MQDQNPQATFMPGQMVVGGAEPPAPHVVPDWQQGLVPGAAEQPQATVAAPQFQPTQPETPAPQQPEQPAYGAPQPTFTPQEPLQQPVQAIAASPVDYGSDVVGESTKNYVVALIFACWFGFFGVDRFYLGRIITGILKLITFGGLGIWVLLDIYKVGTGKTRAKDGLPLQDTQKYLHIGAVVSKVYVVMVGILLIVSFVLSFATRSLLVSSDSSAPNSTYSTSPEAGAADGFVDTTSTEPGLAQ